MLKCMWRCSATRVSYSSPAAAQQPFAHAPVAALDEDLLAVDLQAEDAVGVVFVAVFADAEGNLAAVRRLRSGVEGQAAGVQIGITHAVGATIAADVPRPGPPPRVRRGAPCSARRRRGARAARSGCRPARSRLRGFLREASTSGFQAPQGSRCGHARGRHLRADPGVDQPHVARRREVDVVGDAAQQARDVGHPVPARTGDVGRAAQVRHGRPTHSTSTSRRFSPPGRTRPVMS